MVTLLSRIFIKNRDEVSSPKVRQAYGVLSGAVGIFLNLLLFTGKFFAGLFSNSIAITADAFNNLSDAASSVITLIGFKLAGQKPDPDHPYGHGRIEYLAGLMVSAAILIMAFELIKGSVEKLIHPAETVFHPVIVICLVLSILVKCYMYFYNRSISRKISSEAMMATAKDSLSDTLSTTVVLLTTLIAYFFHIELDGYCGILVGIFIFYTGLSAAKDTVNPLLGTAPDPEFVKSINEIVCSYEDVLGLHDLMVHNYGPGRVIISLHAEVPADGDILALHDTIDNIERRLQDELHCEAVIHMDPICIHDPEVNALKEKVKNILSEIDERLSLHDFRTVKGPTHTNIIFDVVKPYNLALSDEALRQMITEKIAAIDEKYFAVIQIDQKYA
ncbi:MAG: cation diffusion facilitator family transporter [Lachnospiraceae bacterium]